MIRCFRRQQGRFATIEADLPELLVVRIDPLLLTHAAKPHTAGDRVDLQHLGDVAITTGDGNVTEMLKVDPVTRSVWFRGVGKEQGVNPYYQQFWKVSLDGGKPTLLTPEAADHTVSLS